MSLRSLSFRVSLSLALCLVLALPAAARDETSRDQRLARLAVAKERLRGHAPRPATPPYQLSAEEALGAQLYQDERLSLRRNQSCATCHSLVAARDPITGRRLPAPGFVDPRNVETGSAVSAGSVPGRHGQLNAPSSGYAAFSPHFFWNSTDGLYMGGQFWDGRSATLAEQAAQPFLNANEMAMPNKASVIERLRENPQYVRAFRQIYGLDLNALHTGGHAAHAGAIDSVYRALTVAIAAFEKSRALNRFTSKFDFYVAGMADLSPAELRGLEVFNGQGNCAACHPATPTIAPNGEVMPPLFTDFSYDNIGLPRNIDIPGNPQPGEGLGGRADIAARDPSGADVGKHKVMSLRNIALTPPYGHNGVFATLAGIVHFYNTRDVLGVVADIHAPGFGVTGWPAPEIAANVNHDELGALGLDDQQEADLVTFLRTLTDGYPEWGNDPRVPPGSRSPYVATPFPPFP